MTDILLTRNQVGVATAVTASHAAIEAGLVVVKVDVTGASAYAKAATRRLRTLVGLPEIAVQALAGLRPSFPVFFAGPAANVAVTVDVGAGLYLPVVHGADRIGMREISQTLLAYRSAARHGTFRSAQLSGAAIALALPADGAVYNRPIIFPGLACTVSLGSAATELTKDPAGRVVPRPVVHVGLAYDHAKVTTSSSCHFASALKAALESPREQDAVSA